MYLVVYVKEIDGSEIVSGAKSVNLKELIEICLSGGDLAFSILKQDGNEFRDMNDEEFNEFEQELNKSGIETELSDSDADILYKDVQASSNRESD
jgi:rRNA maturation endonuclease Nob1